MIIIIIIIIMVVKIPSYYYYYYYFFMPRYSVPEDLQITNKEKKNYNGCNGLAGSERVLIWDRVPLCSAMDICWNR